MTNALKTELVKFRCTWGEKQKLQDLAREHRSTVADVLRVAALDAATVMPSRDLLAKLIAQIGGIGNNVNQLTKALHEAQIKTPGAMPKEQFKNAFAALDRYRTANEQIREELRQAMKLS